MKWISFLLFLALCKVYGWPKMREKKEKEYQDSLNAKRERVESAKRDIRRYLGHSEQDPLKSARLNHQLYVAQLALLKFQNDVSDEEIQFWEEKSKEARETVEAEKYLVQEARLKEALKYYLEKRQIIETKSSISFEPYEGFRVADFDSLAKKYSELVRSINPYSDDFSESIKDLFEAHAELLKQERAALERETSQVVNGYVSVSTVDQHETEMLRKNINILIDCSRFMNSIIINENSGNVAPDFFENQKSKTLMLLCGLHEEREDYNLCAKAAKDTPLVY